jgi:hypothetical protein
MAERGMTDADCGERRGVKLFFIKQLNRKGRVLPIFIFILNSFPMQ